jgi:outer membrane immunogenic protein
MKPMLVGGALLALATSAMAMDMSPVFQTLPPPAAPAPYDWSGFYGGVNPGNAWGSAQYDPVAPLPPAGVNPNGFGSAHLGYNYQAGPLVLGLEGDMAWRKGMDSVLLAPTGLGNLNLQSQQGWMGTVRPRAGIAADNWLFYGTGGLAYGSFRPDAAGVLTGAGGTGSDANVRSGWTAGGGIEYAGGPAGGQRWSLGLEYLYADLGKASQPTSATPFATPSPTTHDQQQHLLRGKFNYQFDWTMPTLPGIPGIPGSK